MLFSIVSNVISVSSVTCNQCLKCQVSGHKISKNLKIFQKSENCHQKVLSKIVIMKKENIRICPNLDPQSITMANILQLRKQIEYKKDPEKTWETERLWGNKIPQTDGNLNSRTEMLLCYKSIFHKSLTNVGVNSRQCMEEN